MEYQFIHTTHPLYSKAVDLRIGTFFSEITNPYDLINDAMEQHSIHLICRDQLLVFGTGRLTFLRQEAIISQMVVEQTHQRKGIGKELLNRLTEASKESGIQEVTLNARISTVEFYKKVGFLPVSETLSPFQSGLTHQKMKKRI